MELSNEFTVAVPPQEAWDLLTDVERIAPCMPGAQLQEVEGDEYRGVVKVKVGPITAQYKGTAKFVELDRDNLTAVLKADGRDTRGQGNASAMVTATLTAEGTGTKVLINTDLNVSGKVAQFGRGVMADVSAKLIGQFVESLETTVLDGGGRETPPAAQPEPALEPEVETAEPVPASTTPAAPAPAAPVAMSAPPTLPTEVPSAPVATNGSLSSGNGGVRRIDSPEATPVDLLDAAGGSVAKRVVPVLGVLAVLFVLRRLLRRRHDRG